MAKGQIIGGNIERLIIRQKSQEPIEIGELLTVRDREYFFLLQVFDVTHASQISQQNIEMISGLQLEQDSRMELFEPQLRTYIVAMAKPVLCITQGKISHAKIVPPLFSYVEPVSEADLNWLDQSGTFSVGCIRSGSKSLPIQASLDVKKVLTHHVLIAATTGKGKSNLLKVLLWNMLESVEAGTLIFDPHDEYYGRNEVGLKDHPSFLQSAAYYTHGQIPVGAIQLAIHLQLITPRHITSAIEFSQPQLDYMYHYYKKYDVDWIQALFTTDSEIDSLFAPGTISVVVRRLMRLLSISLSANKEIMCNGVYSTTSGKETLQQIIHSVSHGKKVIIDTSFLTGSDELLLSSIITGAVFDAYRHFKQQGSLHSKAVCSVVLEEALRVIGKDVLEKSTNVFATIAKEGRKFNVGLCAITQLPSLIPKDILANMNTKIILGVEMASERNALIESAAQDLSSDSSSIARMNIGEALITSNFTYFALPVKVSYFKDLIAPTQIASGKRKIFGK